MKSSIYIVAILFVTIQNFGQPKKGATNSSKSNKTPTTASSALKAQQCILSTFSSGSATYKTNFKFENNGTNITKATLLFGKQTSIFYYTYDSLNRLNTITDSVSKKVLNYLYNDKNQLVEINGNGSFLPRKFEYDESGKIIKQNTTYKNGESQTLHEYTYDAKGLITKITVYDSKKEKSMTFIPEYDGKINPLKHLGLNINSSEALLGYPSTLYNGNIIKLTTMYDKTPAYEVNGKKPAPGEKEIQLFTIKHNPSGYPIEISFKKANGVASSQNFGYDCKPTK